MRRGEHIIWFERRTKDGWIIERTRTFPRWPENEWRRAFNHQMQIANLHNHNRTTDDQSRQIVFTLES